MTRSLAGGCHGDFTPDTHQVIPLEPCYGPLLIAKDSNSFELGYYEAVQVQQFQGIYYFKSGCLPPGYTNSPPYDHPLDQQGHIALILHSGTAAYSSYIGLVTSGISITTRVENSDIHCHYFDIVGTIPGQDRHYIWGSLHFLPLVSNVFFLTTILGPSYHTWQRESMVLISLVQTVLTCIRCT